MGTTRMMLAKKLICRLLIMIPIMRIIIETGGSQTPVTFRMWFIQKVLGFNRDAYWPVHFSSTVTNYRYVYAGVDVSPGYSHGCYIQGLGKIYIGDYTQIGPNVGIISSNHNAYDSRQHIETGEVRIGKYCWIGMNAAILPGVKLGDFTIVGAGAVVSKSQPGGYCVLAGNPARVIKELDREKCIHFKNTYEYNGYIKAEKFEAFRKRQLYV